jgi:hypothetical protein
MWRETEDCLACSKLQGEDSLMSRGETKREREPSKVPALTELANAVLAWLWRIPSSEMLRRVALVRTDVSEELIASTMRVTRIGEVGTTLAVTSNRHTLRRISKIYFSETSHSSVPTVRQAFHTTFLTDDRKTARDLWVSEIVTVRNQGTT